MAARKHWTCPAADEVDEDAPPAEIRVIYVRINRRWVQVGEMCLRCHQVWPRGGAPRAEAAAA